MQKRTIKCQFDHKTLCRWKRAVFTVEASVIVPIAVVITALLIILTFYVHNRCWYRCAAYESAIKGNGGTVVQTDRASVARIQAEGRIQDQVMLGETPELMISSDRQKTTVAFTGKSYSIFTRYLTPFQVKAEVERVHPVKEVRVRWALKLAKDVVTESG
jgi:hypothetical protein